jgi:ankyrin repeat protein
MGIDVNATTTAGETALHDAVRQRFTGVIQFLADHGANLNVKNKRGETPLSLALADRRDVGAGDPRYTRRLNTAELLQKLGATEAKEEPAAKTVASPPR